ncbi:MAG: hypothetical protein Q8R33_05580 [Burkholderiales bacterium]|nr:hypothetical protein [Burkholderiales bacterium]
MGTINRRRQFLLALVGAPLLAAVPVAATAALNPALLPGVPLPPRVPRGPRSPRGPRAPAPAPRRVVPRGPRAPRVPRP